MPLSSCIGEFGSTLLLHSAYLQTFQLYITQTLPPTFLSQLSSTTFCVSETLVNTEQNSYQHQGFSDLNSDSSHSEKLLLYPTLDFLPIISFQFAKETFSKYLVVFCGDLDSLHPPVPLCILAYLHHYAADSEAGLLNQLLIIHQRSFSLLQTLYRHCHLPRDGNHICKSSVSTICGISSEEERIKEAIAQTYSKYSLIK